MIFSFEGEWLDSDTIEKQMWPQDKAYVDIIKRQTMTRFQEHTQGKSGAGAKVDKLLSGVLGLCGESGKCADILRTHMFQGYELQREKLIDGLGDVLFYIAQTATGLGVSLQELADRNMEKKRKCNSARTAQK